MLKWSFCDYSDAYIFVSETIEIPNTGTEAVQNNRKNIITKNSTPFTDCISEINNTPIDNAKDIDVVMPMYNLIEYRDNYSKTTERFWQFYVDGPFLDAKKAISDFPADNNNCVSFKFKLKIVGRTGNDGTKKFKTMVPLKYLSNFRRTLGSH